MKKGTNNMSWIQKLVETYDNCQSEIGYAKEKNQRPLLPICHITQQAHIEIAIDAEGNFLRARVITEANEATTIIPCTEESGSRSGQKPVNHPLCDKLQYVAGDFAKFGGSVTSGFSKEPETPFLWFLKTLSEWCESQFSHPRAQAVLAYVQKRRVIEDLVDHQILYLESGGKLAAKDDIERDKNTKDIFSIIDSQDNAFVRWIVDIPGNPENRVWQDKSLWESWINYYLNSRKNKALCYVTGEAQILTSNHPKYIRREGDGAKIISSNDTNGFTFRGRFKNADQACGVGLEASHKSHYALLWLISKQGYNRDGLAIVAWSTSGKPVPQPTNGALSLLWGDDIPAEEDAYAYTAQELAIKLRNRIAGYGKELKNTDNVVVMGLDSVVPGRLAITYYRDLAGSDFLQKIENWHSSCSWLHTYLHIQEKDGNRKENKRFVPFVGAPAPDDIAEAVYATNRNGKLELDEKLRKLTIMRLLPCIVDEQPIPRDLVESVVRRASNRIGLEDWQWEKTLSIACSLFKKSRQGKEEYVMSLDENRRTRDYLYGRLLAVADVLEERALYQGEKKRATNAARYLQQFSQHPFSTWKQIHDLLNPYIIRLAGATFYKNQIAEVMKLFDPDDFTNNAPLSGEYLLGYYCQRQTLKQFEKKSEPPKAADKDNSEDKDE